MIWQGKALGALIGAVAAGPAGALFGTFIGHLFDVQASVGADIGTASADAAGAQGVQERFFRTTFLVMGHLAKADGRVSEDEIRAARAIMNEFRLGEREVSLAIQLYTQGKSREFPLEQTLRELRHACRNRPDLCRMFVQIQLQTALWGDGLSTASRQVLARVCATIGVSAYEVVQMEALLRMQAASRQPQQRTQTDTVAQAYEVLGVSRTARSVKNCSRASSGTFVAASSMIEKSRSLAATSIR